MLSLATIPTKVKLYAVLGVVALLLLGTIAFLFYGWQGATEKNAKLSGDVQELEQANKDNQAEIQQLLVEKQLSQAAVAKLQTQREEIIKTNNQELKEKDKKLKDLGAAYEKVTNFLNVVVPPAFVDQWMRARSGQNRGEGHNDPSHND